MCAASVAIMAARWNRAMGIAQAAVEQVYLRPA
jgi:hypothetical protein